MLLFLFCTLKWEIIVVARRPAKCRARISARAATAGHAVPRAGQWCMIIVGCCTTGRALRAHSWRDSTTAPSDTMTNLLSLGGPTFFCFDG